jgi:DNA-binding NarL/FixJ family response regulator
MRAQGETWVLFFRTTRKSDGKRVENKIPIGLIRHLPDASGAWPRSNDCAKIITLTTYAGDVQIFRALKAGAQGYLLKAALHYEPPDNIRAVYAGRKVMAPEAAAQVAEHSGEETLTPKELEVLRLIAAGNANKEFAAHLSITEESVKSRVKNILDKLMARDRTPPSD